jgi:hypothetical protein
MLERDGQTFSRMAREFPVRTGLFTFGPLVLALILLANSHIHDGSLLYTIAFAVLLVAYSVQITRYHLATFQRTTLSRELG